MAIALSSLRVTSEMDASAYVRGASQKVAGDQQMIAADKARNASLAQADAALVKAIPGMQAVSKALLDGYGSGQQFEAMVRRIGNAVDRGMGLDRANLLLENAYRKFGLTTDAAALAQRGLLGMADAASKLNARYAALEEAATSANAAMRASSAQTGINESFGIGAAPGRSAKESADAFMADFGGLEGVVRLKAKEAGEAFGAALDQRMVAGVSKAARDSAAIFEADLRRIDEIAAMRGAQAGQNFQQSLNDSFGIGGSAATSKGATYSALAEQVQRLDQIEQARAAHLAASSQQDLASIYGLDRQAKSARDSAAAFQEASAAEDALASKAAALRAALNPLDAEFVRLGKEMTNYKALLNQGVISQQEFEGAQLLAGKRLSDFEKNLKSGANAGRVMSGEMVNLSYQLNDVITGIALGQSPFMIFGQQGGQIFQIFQNSKASVAEFAKEAGSRLLGFFTTSRLVFGGIAGVVGVAAFALNDYLAKQEKVALGLTGAGRASGASITSINSAANAGSSLTGFSVSEARNLAVALATTGKVANDNILPIVQMGKDIAHAFGVDAAGATELLAKAFSDPASGMDTLNQRLGFLDASMKQQITNLIAQNKLWDAQKILQAGAASSLKDVNDAVGTSTKFWTALGNIVGNAWDKIGEAASRGTGIGLKIGLAEQIQNAHKEVENFENLTKNPGLGGYSGFSIALEKAKEKLENLTRAQRDNAAATVEAQQRQRSFAQDAAVRFQQPNIDAMEKSRNELEFLIQTMIDVEASGGRSSEILEKMGRSYEELGNAVAIANGNFKTLKTEFQQTVDNARIAFDAITAFSPSAKAEIARRQSTESTNNSKMTPTEKATLAEQAYQNALKTSNTMLSEAARERLLAATQGVRSAQVEIDIIGESVGETYRLRTEEQTRQQLEQEAARNRTSINKKHLADLNEQIRKTAELKQLEAQRSLRSDASFDRSQIGLTDQEQSINAKLRSVYGDGYASNAAAQADKELLRFNANLRMTSDLGRDALKGFVSDLMHGKSAAEALNGVISKISDKLVQMTIDNVWSTAMGGKGGSGFNWGSLFGGSGSAATGGGATSTGAAGVGGIGGLYHTGGIVGLEGGQRYIHPAHFDDAPRFHTGIGPGERRAILQDGEGVFTQGQMRALGMMAGSGGSSGAVTVNVFGAPAGTTATSSTKSGRGGLTVDVILRQVEDGIARNIAGGQSPMNEALQTKYGLDPTRGMG